MTYFSLVLAFHAASIEIEGTEEVRYVVTLHSAAEGFTYEVRKEDAIRNRTPRVQVTRVCALDFQHALRLAYLVEDAMVAERYYAA